MSVTEQCAAGSRAGLRLEHFPVTFFAIGMGMMGLTLALHAAEQAHATGNAASQTALALSVTLLAVISGFYVAKALRFPGAVVVEWHHPVRIAFFPAISISLLLLSVALLPDWPGLARTVWMIGTLTQGILALSVIGSWIGHRAFSHRPSYPGLVHPRRRQRHRPDRRRAARLDRDVVALLLRRAGLLDRAPDAGGQPADVP